MDSFATELRRAQRQLEAALSAPAPAPPVAPPPLPAHTAKPVVVADKPAPPTAAPSMPEPITLSGASYTPPVSTDRRSKRVRKGRRSKWVTIAMVVSVLYAFNWMRNQIDPPARDPRPRNVDNRRPPQGDRLGKAIDDTVADVLENVGPNSPAIQLARAKIYWERAKKDKDPALMKKAEDTFNEVLRLKPDADVEEEARDGLREIAAAKEPVTAPEP